MKAFLVFCALTLGACAASVDAQSDASRDITGDRVAMDTRCPASTAEGTPCAPEGLTCGGPCSDPCQFCNLSQCARGRWTRVEVPPAPCRDAGFDAGSSNVSTASFVWQAPQGVVGAGPAWVVSGDGTVRMWSNVPEFNPATPPATLPTLRATVPRATVEGLFTAWVNLRRGELPHGTGQQECEASISVRPCATCEWERLRYSEARTVTPELNPLWFWFESNITAASPAMLPRSYCRFD